MCELDYKAKSDADNKPEKTKPNNIIKTLTSQFAEPFF